MFVILLRYLFNDLFAFVQVFLPFFSDGLGGEGVETITILCQYVVTRARFLDYYYHADSARVRGDEAGSWQS